MLHTWDDLLGVFPGVFGVKTGHTSAAGWNQVTAVRREAARSIYATILGSPSRARRDADLETLLAYGLAQYRAGRTRSSVRTATTPAVALPYGRAPLALVAQRPLRAVVRVGSRR